MYLHVALLTSISVILLLFIYLFTLLLLYIYGTVRALVGIGWKGPKVAEHSFEPI